MERLTMALIGCGAMGRRHLRGLGALRAAGLLNVELTAVCDLDARAATRAADEAEAWLGTRPRVVASVDELLHDDETRALDIVTEPSSHHRIAVPALQAGRHVLCEKPLSITIRGCQAILDAHAAAPEGTVLATEEHFRRGPVNRIAAAAVQAGIIGEVFLIQTLWAGGDDRILLTPWRHLRERGAIALDNGVHLADVQSYLAGSPWQEVWGRGFIAVPVRKRTDEAVFAADMYTEAMQNAPAEVRATAEDSIVALYRLASGASAMLTWLPAGPGHQYLERSLHGRHGSMLIPSDRSGKDLTLRLESRELGARASLLTELGPDTISEVEQRLFGDPVHPDRPFAEVDAAHLATTIHDFARAALDGTAPEVDGREGMAAVAAILAAVELEPLGRPVRREEMLAGRVTGAQADIDQALGLGLIVRTTKELPMPDRPWKLGYNTLTWNETRDPDPERVFATIKAAGWEGIELLDPDANWWGTPSRVRRMAENAGIPIVATLGVVQIDDARRTRQTEIQKRLIDYGAEVGASAYVFIGGDRVYRRLPTDDDLGRLADVASELVEYAAPLGMSVNHHSHPRCTIERESEQDRFLELTDPRVQVCVDIGISAFMDEDWLGQIARYAGRTGYVHLKDWALGKYCILGEGTKGIDWSAVLAAFTATGFDGWITTELSWYGDSDADAACYANRAHLRSIGY